MKWLLRIVLGLIAVVVLLLVLCIQPVQRTPYQQTDYYRQTLARLAELRQPEPERSPLSVGVGKAGITPPVGVPLAGFGARKGKPSVGVHDSLYVRVIALQAGARQAFVIGYDALLLYPTVAQAIQQRLALKPEQLFFTATHTHSGPGGWGNGFVEEQFAGKPDARVAAMLVDSTVVAVQRARKSCVAATWQAGCVHAPRFIRNRLLGDGAPVDDELCYVSLQSQGKPLALLATYSAHATVLSADNLLISGDYPGYLERRVEKQTGAMAIFSAAGLGSHSHRGEGKGFERSRFIGEGLADSLMKYAFAGIGHDAVALSCHRLEVAPPTLQIRLNREYRLASWLAHWFIHFRDCYIAMLALDDFRLIGAPAEFSGQLALQVKAAAAQQGRRVSVTSFNGCYLGYVVPSQYDELDGYETRTMCWFGPYFGDYLAEMMIRMAG